MLLKDFWIGTGAWLRAHKPFGIEAYQPQIDDEGLINHDINCAKPDFSESKHVPLQDNHVVVKTIQAVDKREPIEKLQDGLGQLVEQLQRINEHLDLQVTQQKNLMSRIERLPDVLETFPLVAENQKQLTEQLLEQLKASAMKNQQFMDVVEKIPVETGKQTETLISIDQQLAATADIDVQIAENVNKFNETLGKLNENTAGQAESISQMNRAFAARDRYLKYFVSMQSKRFVWIFVAAMSVCLAAISILAGIIVYLWR